MVCDAGEKYFAPTLIGGVGADWHGCEQVCGIAGSDSREKYFARTLADGVGADGTGCEQVCGGDGLRYGRKIFRPYIDWWCWGLRVGL